MWLLQENYSSPCGFFGNPKDLTKPHAHLSGSRFFIQNTDDDWWHFQQSETEIPTLCFSLHDIWPIIVSILLSKGTHLREKHDILPIIVSSLLSKGTHPRGKRTTRAYLIFVTCTKCRAFFTLVSTKSRINVLMFFWCKKSCFGVFSGVTFWAENCAGVNKMKNITYAPPGGNNWLDLFLQVRCGRILGKNEPFQKTGRRLRKELGAGTDWWFPVWAGNYGFLPGLRAAGRRSCTPGPHVCTYPNIERKKPVYRVVWGYTSGIEIATE